MRIHSHRFIPPPPRGPTLTPVGPQGQPLAPVTVHYQLVEGTAGTGALPGPPQNQQSRPHFFLAIVFFVLN